MWRAAIGLCAVLVLGSPAYSHAQYNDTDRQNPTEYTDEDSQPLAIVSYALYPIGFAAEWLAARPLHYVFRETPISPVFEPVGGNGAPAPRIPIIPDNSLTTTAEVEAYPQEIVIKPGGGPPSTAEPKLADQPAQPPAAPVAPAKPAQSNRQPELH